MPDLGSVHIDQALTNLSIMYTNEMFLADQVFPRLPVEKRSDKYFVYDKATALTGSGLDGNGRATSLTRPGREAATIAYTLSTDSYYAEEYRIRELVTDAQRRYSDNPLQPDNDATIHLTNTLLLDNEQMVANLVGNASNYPSANKSTLTTGASGTSWASYASANSLPMKNLQDAKTQIMKGIQRTANSLAITHDAAKVLTEHPTYRDEFKYVSAENLTASGLMPLIKGLTVIELTTQTTSGNVWNASDSNPFALVFYRDPDIGPRTVHFGRTFDAPDDMSGAHGMTIRRYRWDPLKGDYIEASMLRDYKFIAVDSSSKAIGGYLYLSVTV